MFCHSALDQLAQHLGALLTGASATNIPEAELGKADVVSLVVRTDALERSFSWQIAQGLPLSAVR